MDPFLGAVGASVVANIVAKAIQGVGKLVTITGWERADELTRVFYLLEAVFSEELPAIVQTELESWRGNAAFMEVYSQLSAGAEPEEQHEALVAAIEPLVGPTATETPRQIAERIAQVLPYLLVEAKEGAEKVLLALRQLWNVVETFGTEHSAKLDELSTSVSVMSAPVVIFGADWPPAAEDALRRAQSADAQGLAALTRALDGKVVVDELPKLVNNPRGWMRGLAGETWELIALRCENEGLWEEARAAWLIAREKPGTDYAGYTVRAAEAAVGAEDRDGAVALLDAARSDQPTHPRVAFHDALGKKDETEVLTALDAIDGADPELAAMVLIAKASAHLRLRDVEAARASLDSALQGGACDMIAYRLADTTASAQEALREMHPSAVRLGELAVESLRMEAELLRRRQYTQAAEMRSHAAAFHAFVGDFPPARQVLTDGIPSYQVDSADARLTYGMAAAHLDLDEVIRAMLRPEDAHQARHRYLSALLKTHGDEAAQQEAADDLDVLLGDDHAEIRAIAAIRRLALAWRTPDVGWSDEAEAIVGAREVAPAVVFKALWLENSGRRDEAERELLAHSDEGWALVELMNLAARAENWARAAVHAEAALKHDIDWHSQLTAAEALRLAEDDPRANTQFRWLAENADAPILVRAAAYRRLTQAAFNSRDYGAAAALTAAWVQIDPEDGDAAWAYVMSLAFLGRDAEALAAFREHGLHPRQPAEYRFAAQLHISRADPLEALRTVIAYADEQSPASEELEAFVISAALRVRGELPEDLSARVSAERFVSMFPNSEYLRTLSIDELKRYIEGDLADHAKNIQEVEDKVFDDGMATGVLAAVTNNDVGGLWMRLSWGRGLPMGYGNSQLDELERQDAREAIGGPALWDATSVFVAGHLLSTLTDTIRTSLPDSKITQAALADIAEGAREAQVNQLSDQPRQELGYDLVENKPRMVTWEPEAERAFAERASGALELAQKFEAVVNADANDPQPEDQPLESVEKNSFRAFVATFSAARRLRVPIYSDDREIRRMARADGMATFGTFALIDALAGAGHLAEDQRSEARHALLRNRAQGVNPTGDELVSLARSANWQLTFELAVAALDRGPWRSDTAAAFLAWLELLRHARREAPQEFSRWVARFLDAIHHTRPDLSVALQAQHLVTTSLVSTADDALPFLRALVRALREVQQYFPESLAGAPALGLLGLAVILSKDTYVGPAEAAGALLLRAWLMLPLEHQLATVAVIL